jgi:HD-GYP domain-containing protein (c-di-GMP phosphodiesterase class II)
MTRGRRVRLGLRILLLSGTLLVITILSIALAISGYRSAERALLSASLDDAARLGQSIDGEVKRLLDPAKSMVRLLAHSTLLQPGGWSSSLDRLPTMADVLAGDRLLDAVYVGYPDGNFVLFRALRDEVAGQDFGAPPRASYLVETVATEPGGIRVGEWRFYDDALQLLDTRPRPDYVLDPRERGWYRSARSGDGTILTEPYLFFTTHAVGVTLARKGVGNDAVIGADVRVDTLGAAMDRLRGTPGTALALVAADGAVLASADQRGPAATAPGDTRLARVTALKGAGLDRLFEAAQAEAGAGLVIKSLEASGRTYQAIAVPVEGLGGGRTYLLVSIPADELLTGARDVVGQLGLVALAVIGLALVAGWLVADLIALPIQALSKDVMALADFDFEHGIGVRSRIAEIDDLAAMARRTSVTIRGFLGITAALNEETDLDRMLAQVVDQLVEATASVGGAVYLADREGSGLERAVVADRADRDLFEPVLRLEPGDGPSPLAAVVAQAAREGRRGAASVGRLVAVALRTRDDTLVGVLVLDAPAGDRGDRRSVLRFVSSLAGTAAVAIETRQLIGAQKAMMEGLIRLIAGAIDAKSPYTGGHCQRVPVIAQMLAEAAHETRTGPFADFTLSEADREALHVAAWLHDCGKVTTPEYVVDKATKLETIHNRIHEIRTRFEVLKRDVEIAALRRIAAGADPAAAEAGVAREWAALDADFGFVAECNLGDAPITAAHLARLQAIAGRRWRRTLDDRLGLSREELARAVLLPAVPLPAEEALLADRPHQIIPRADTGLFAADSPWGFRMDVPKHRMNRGELYNLSIPRGTLTAEERHIVNDHIVQTIVILSKLPMPRHLRAVPEIAGGHHERMDGRGYPRRLTGATLSPLARMMAIADVFEALTAADRPYKPAKSLAQAIAIMSAMAGEGHLDPDLFALFLESGVCRRYAEVYLAPDQIDAVDPGRSLGPVPARSAAAAS